MDARVLLLVPALGCFESHEIALVGISDVIEEEPACDPAEIPDWLTGEFAIVGMGRSCLARDELELYADSCGRGGWWFYDVDFGGGGEGRFERVTDDHWELWVDGERAVSIHREGWWWYEREMLRVDATGIGMFDELWAVQAANAPAVEHDLRETFCAVEESWSIHTTSVAPADAWGEGGVRITEGRDTGLVVRFGADEVQVYDGRLPTCGPDCARDSSGSVVAWDGHTGTIRYRNTHGVCAALDGDATFTRDGDELVLEQDWVIVDISDMDRDGSLNDRVIRRTRTVLREDACP